jgi:hypothetical protein
MVEWELGAVFVGVPAAKPVGLSPNQTIFLSDVAEALEITAKLTDAVAGEVTREWDTAARAYVQRLD